jgi:hypothetical protein
MAKIKIVIKLKVDEKEVEMYGGVEIYKGLIEDVLNRYGNAEYFNMDLFEKLKQEEKAALEARKARRIKIPKYKIKELQSKFVGKFVGKKDLFIL